MDEETTSHRNPDEGLRDRRKTRIRILVAVVRHGQVEKCIIYSMSQSVISTAMIERGGYFYSGLMRRRGDDGTLKNCIEKTLEKLLISDTSLRKPGILLGEIQSGKTRAFLGVIALAFDNGYDMAVVLTKGTKALTEQTLKRLHEDFSEFEDDSKVQIHDIMLFPKNMVPYELSQKLVIVAKKETHNLQRVLKTLTERYPDLKDKKVLIIDDEADFASISFRKEKETGTIESGTIATQIDNIRMSVDKSEFLQVTATPYSLYLQPSEEDGVDPIFPPKRPAFTNSTTRFGRRFSAARMTMVFTSFRRMTATIWFRVLRTRLCSPALPHLSRLSVFFRLVSRRTTRPRSRRRLPTWMIG